MLWENKTLTNHARVAQVTRSVRGINHSYTFYMYNLIPERGEKMTKKMHGAKLAPELVEQAHAAAWWVGRGLSLAKIVEDGLRRELDRLEEINGGPFPAVTEKKTSAGKIRQPQDRTRAPLKTITFRLDGELLDRLRAAAEALEITHTEIIERGMRDVLKEIQAKYNKGKPFGPPEDS